MRNTPGMSSPTSTAKLMPIRDPSGDTGDEDAAGDPLERDHSRIELVVEAVGDGIRIAHGVDSTMNADAASLDLAVNADFGCTASGSFTANSSGFTFTPCRAAHTRVNSAPNSRI